MGYGHKGASTQLQKDNDGVSSGARKHGKEIIVVQSIPGIYTDPICALIRAVVDKVVTTREHRNRCQTAQRLFGACFFRSKKVPENLAGTIEHRSPRNREENLFLINAYCYECLNYAGPPVF